MAHVGACMKVTIETNCTSKCSGVEDQTDVPVCGSDGNVYRWVKYRYNDHLISPFFKSILHTQRMGLIDLTVIFPFYR